MLTFFVILTAIISTLIAGSFVEWFVHRIMHARLTLPYLRRTHEDHHIDYGQKEGFQNHNHGHHVHLPWWARMLSVAFFAAIGSWISYMLGRWDIAVAVGLTGFLYDAAYQYIHTCLHVPAGRWFEGTRLFRFLEAFHIIHHVRGKDFERPVNLCVVFPLADWVMGTRYRHMTKMDYICDRLEW